MMMAIPTKYQLQTDLLAAVRENNGETVESLLAQGVDPDTTYHLTGRQPVVCLAAGEGRADIVDILCRYHASTSRVNRDGLTPLHLAAANGHATTLKVLLANWTDINQLSKGGREDSALHQAVYRGHTDIVRLLLNNGAKVDVKDVDGLTPLMYAAAASLSDIIDLLVVTGKANTCLTDRRGNTALLLYTASHRIDPTSMTQLAQCVCQRSAKEQYRGRLTTQDNQAKTMVIPPTCPLPSLPNIQGTFPLLEVVKSRSQTRHAGLRTIIQLGADLDAYCDRGWSPLHVACSAADWLSVQMLVCAGAKSDAIDSLGRTPLLLTLQHGNLEMAEKMLAAGCQPTLPSIAAGFLSPEVVKAWQAICRKPQSLVHLTRRILRLEWAGQVRDELKKSELPVTLKDYVYSLALD